MLKLGESSKSVKSWHTDSEMQQQTRFFFCDNLTFFWHSNCQTLIPPLKYIVYSYKNKTFWLLSVIPAELQFFWQWHKTVSLVKVILSFFSLFPLHRSPLWAHPQSTHPLPALDQWTWEAGPPGLEVRMNTMINMFSRTLVFMTLTFNNLLVTSV